MYQNESKNNRLNRRSFMARIAGASVLGSVAIPKRANAQSVTGRTDSDSGASADRAGYGQTWATDSDSGAAADRAGHGRGASGTSSTGLTDSDQGAGADRAGYGRGAGGRDAISREQTPDLPVAQPVTARDVETIRRAFIAMADGDPNPALQMLDPRVRWRAVASRALEDAIVLDRRGAEFYLRQMARNIASGERRLELISIAAQGDRVVVESQWVKTGEPGSECAHAWSMVSGMVMVVNEVVSERSLSIPPNFAQ